MSTERNNFQSANDNEPYSGVVLRGVDNDMFGIRLHHENPLFMRDLAIVDEYTCIADWRMIAMHYNLPMLIEQENGELTKVNQRLGSLNVMMPTVRKRGIWSLYHRRPRHALRRKLAIQQQSRKQN